MRALGYLALGALVAVVWVASPVSIGLLLGALVAFALQTSYERLQRRWGPRAAGLTCSLGSTAVLVGILGGFGYLMVTRSLSIANEIADELRPDGKLRVLADRWSAPLARLHLNPLDLLSRLEGTISDLGSRLATFVADVATRTFSGLMVLFFMALTVYSVLRNWPLLVGRAELLLPFNQRHTRALFDQFRNVGRHVFLGTLSTGLVQGLLAGLGYWIAGVAEPAFFGVLTAIASLVPVLGTMLVWLPLGIVYLVIGRSIAGLFVVIYGALVVVVLSDYVIRPMLLGAREEGVPALLTFVALVGGVEVFGVVGLLLGPVIVTVSMAVVRTYEEEVQQRNLALRSRARTRSSLPPSQAPASQK
jgi:predicted PurR-regulated permease PerM